MSFFKNNSGQLTVVGILVIYFILVVMYSLMPEISQESKDVSTHANISGKPEAVLFDIIPMFIIVIFLVTIALSAQTTG